MSFGKLDCLQDTKQSDQSTTGNASPSQSTSTDVLRILHAISPQCTGLLDELLALQQAGILVRTKPGGVAVLANDWYAQIDPLVLDDMHERWHLTVDTANKYRVHPRIQRELANYWIRVDEGWALNDDLSVIVYDQHEWDEWRHTFQKRVDQQTDQQDGIGNFGI